MGQDCLTTAIGIPLKRRTKLGRGKVLATANGTWSAASLWRQKRGVAPTQCTRIMMRKWKRRARLARSSRIPWAWRGSIVPRMFARTTPTHNDCTRSSSSKPACDNTCPQDVCTPAQHPQRNARVSMQTHMRSENLRQVKNLGSPLGAQVQRE